MDGDGPRLETGWGYGPCRIVPDTLRSERTRSRTARDHARACRKEQ